MDDVECPKLPNMPWKVDSSEYETYKGHLYSGLHGVFFKTCSGNTYKPVWTPDFEENSIWPDNGNQGGRVFIELLGRLDPYSKGVIPSQSLYVGQIINIDREKSEYCE